ncbi:hypothetical protein AKO1_006624 [Acrasis kona]|uniref:RGS domain-containing protein n=1 Tax=Acrasis kona TaxID=1008807 RepID=A0AAW2ZMX9_9EUKA
MAYMKQVNELLSRIKEMGGEVFGVSSEKQHWVDTTKEAWELDYTLVGDQKSKLAKRYGVNLYKRDSKGFNFTVELLRGKSLNDRLDTLQNEKYPEGISQCAVVVIQNNEILYKWCLKPKKRNGYGGWERIAPTDIFEVIKYYFSEKDIISSVNHYIRQDLRGTFINMRKDKSLRDLFADHLANEFCLEGLEFIEKVDEMVSGGFPTKEQEVEIYNTFIDDDSDKAVNLSGKIKRKLADIILNDGDRSSVRVHAFEGAIESVTITLMSDNFERFTKTKEFNEKFMLVYPEVMKKIQKMSVDAKPVVTVPSPGTTDAPGNAVAPSPIVGNLEVENTKNTSCCIVC